MRASGHTFKDELAVYRKAIAKGPNNAHRALILKILDEWQANADAERAWATLVEASARAGNPMLPAADFIRGVIFTRLESERLARMIREAPAVLSRLSTQADRDFKKGRIEKAVQKKSAARAFAKQADAMLGRKKNDAARQRFIRMWSDTFKTNCGKPLHDVVRVLAEAAFGKPTTADAVRWEVTNRRIRPPK